MNFRNIYSWCIRNPVAPIVLFVGLMLAGIIAFSQMTITQNPDIDFPVVLVGVSQPGAAPAEMEKQVTQEVEAAVRSVNGVDEIDSSVSEGYSQTVVQLQIGTPVEVDHVDATERIRRRLECRKVPGVFAVARGEDRFELAVPERLGGCDGSRYRRRIAGGR